MHNPKLKTSMMTRKKKHIGTPLTCMEENKPGRELKDKFLIFKPF